MAERVAFTGNEAAAHALKQINPDVIAAFPITPSTELMHKFAQHVADGDVVTELVTVESEHSAMSACVGAATAGARCGTATSANGLALMWEILYIAASNRLPILACVVNRALSAPINIHCDHSDSMGARDSGWIQLYAENGQEAYDNTVQAIRIGEHADVRLPVMSCLDGFILSHTVEGLDVLEDAEVTKFIGEMEMPHNLLNVDNAETFGPFTLQNYYFEFKKQQEDAMKAALKVVEEVGAEYGKLSGRSYGLIEPFQCDDADVVIMGLGSSMGTMAQAAEDLKAEGLKCGVLKVRCFRPFPAAAIREALGNAKIVGVLDRALSFGNGGPLFHEVRSACYGGTTPFVNYVYGLGGRDLSLDDCKATFRRLIAAKDNGAPADTQYIGLRE